jgi:predicted ATPase
MLITKLPTGSHPCDCTRKRHDAKRVVLTGGPGGGKTAILEMARRYFCRHVVILPEAASIVFGGGFPRVDTPEGRKTAQRAIFRVQQELEALALQDREAAVILCDRGTLDGLAYWPGTHKNFFQEFDTTPDRELAKYSAVVHVEVPGAATWYRREGIRKEGIRLARTLDQKIARSWSAHPHQHTVSAHAGFLDKLAYAIELLRSEVPPCCRTHLHATANGGS